MVAYTAGRSLYLRDVTTGAAIGPPIELEFDADGLALLVGEHRVPAHPATWIDDLCRRIDPGVSEPEWQKLIGSVRYSWTCASVRG